MVTPKQAMVAKAHRLGLSPGWYLNNCGCAENHFDSEMVDKVSVRVRVQDLQELVAIQALDLSLLKRTLSIHAIKGLIIIVYF